MCVCVCVRLCGCVCVSGKEVVCAYQQWGYNECVGCLCGCQLLQASIKIILYLLLPFCGFLGLPLCLSQRFSLSICLSPSLSLGVCVGVCVCVCMFVCVCLTNPHPHTPTHPLSHPHLNAHTTHTTNQQWWCFLIPFLFLNGRSFILLSHSFFLDSAPPNT